MFTILARYDIILDMNKLSPSETQTPFKIYQTKHRGIKRSLRAKAVAQEVIKTALTGSKTTLKEIALKNGYSLASATSGTIVRTKSYKEELAPVLAQHDRILKRILDKMENVPLDNQNIVALSIAKKNITHDKQLLSGKATENVNSAPNIIVYSSTDPLNRQLLEKSPVIKDTEILE